MRKHDDKKAVALKYADGDHAPRVVARGKGKLADRILQIAEKNGIYIEENELLSNALIELDPGEYIPEEMYEIVAQLLAFVYTVELEER